jgi:hypothetical protein
MGLGAQPRRWTAFVSRRLMAPLQTDHSDRGESCQGSSVGHERRDPSGASHPHPPRLRLCFRLRFRGQGTRRVTACRIMPMRCLKSLHGRPTGAGFLPSHHPEHPPDALLKGTPRAEGRSAWGPSIGHFDTLRIVRRNSHYSEPARGFRDRSSYESRLSLMSHRSRDRGATRERDRGGSVEGMIGRLAPCPPSPQAAIYGSPPPLDYQHLKIPFCWTRFLIFLSPRFPRNVFANG